MGYKQGQAQGVFRVISKVERSPSQYNVDIRDDEGKRSPSQGTTKEHRKHEARDVPRSWAREDEGTPQARGARRAPIVRNSRDDGGTPRARDARRAPTWRKGRRRNTANTRRATRADRGQVMTKEHCKHEARDARRSWASDDEGTPKTRGARRAPIMREGRRRNTTNTRRAARADRAEGEV